MAASRRRIAGARCAAVMVMLGVYLAGLAPDAVAQDNVDGNLYVSPTYGYELEWDEDVWELDEDSSNRRDTLVLFETDATSYVYVEGYEAYDGDPDDCLEGSADEILGADAVSDVELMEDEDGDVIEGEADGVVFAAYTYEFETDDGAQDRASYFTCQTLVEDEAVLAFSFVGLLAEVEDDLPLWLELFDGLTLSDNADDEDDQADDEAADDEESDDSDRDDDAGSGDGVTAATYGGGPSRGGEQPGPAPADEPEVIWTFETGDDFVGATAVTVSAGDGLVFTSSNAVYAFDIETGEEVWTYESEANVGFVAPLALADGVLYAAGEDGSLYAFEPDSGDVIWQSELTASGMPVNGGPLVDGDTIYVTAWDGNAYVVEAETGDVLDEWSLGGMSFGQPAFADGLMVLSAPSNGVMALDAESGEDIWVFETEGTVYSALAVADGVVYFGSDDGMLFAVELESGDEVWSVDAGAPVSGAMAVVDDVLYAANGDGLLVAYDAESGDELWTAEIEGGTPGGVSVAETEDGDLLIFVGDGEGVLHAFDEDGEDVYAAEVTDAAIFAPVTVLDGTIYVSARDGAVYALTED